jgi:HKD family nuclease
VYVINQPWDGRGEQLGAHIVRLLLQDSPCFDVFQACVAFAKSSGVLQLAPALQTFRDRGGRVEIVVGIDEGITTKQALELLIQYSTVAYVFNNPASSFHSKVYLFEMPQKRSVAFIGSSNLTSGGLYTNYETNVGLEFDLAIEADRELYDRVHAAFLSASDVASGNAKQLDTAVVEELVRARKVADETRSTGRRPSSGRTSTREPLLFPRIPVPPAPRIDPSVTHLIPRIRSVSGRRAAPVVDMEFQSWQVFMMTLGERDTRQKAGYSRDVFIPLAARDLNPEFWGWPAKFKAERGETVGHYPARRINMLVRPVAGQAQVIENVRLYYYDIKHEFRLNCSKLVEGAHPGDLLVIQRSTAGTLFDGRTYEFEAAVISTERSEYQTFIRDCRNQVPKSLKRWGYL